MSLAEALQLISAVLAVTVFAVSLDTGLALPLPLNETGIAEAHPPLGRPLTSRVRTGLAVAGLALGMAMTIGRDLDDRALGSWRGEATWVATMLPPRPDVTTPFDRVELSALPR